MTSRQLNILITGTDKAAGQSVWRAMSRLDVNVRGVGALDRDALVEACVRERIDVVVPTLDRELLNLARAQEQFSQIGVKLLIANPQAVHTCQDRVALFEELSPEIPMPRTEVFNRGFDLSRWQFPVVLKTRRAQRKRYAYVVESERGLDRCPRSPNLLVQEYLPGDEYVVDLVAMPGGGVMTALPAPRHAVCRPGTIARALQASSELTRLSRRAAERAHLRYISRMVFRRDRTGTLRLITIVAGVPDGVDTDLTAGTELLRQSLGLLGVPTSRVSRTQRTSRGRVSTN